MHTYPFSAAGLEELKLALPINAVSPSVGGVLVRGQKGTAKSTIVRAIARLLPDVTVVAGCRFSCDPDEPDPVCPDGRPADGRMTGRPTLGDRETVAVRDSLVARTGERFRGHEFRGPDSEPAWQWSADAPGKFTLGNLMASYLHLHWGGRPETARRFVGACA